MASINSLSGVSAKTGIGGLVSGMDIDELVRSLSNTSREKIIKQQRSIQKLEWKQTAYRSVTKALAEFQKSYLDILSPTNFRSAAFFNTVKKVTSSSDAISVSASGSANEGNITINSIEQLATSQTIKSATSVSKSLSGTLPTAAEDITALVDSLSGKSILLTLDGKAKTVSFDSTFIANANADGLTSALQTAVDRAFGVNNPTDRIIEIAGSVGEFSITATGSEIKVNNIGEDTETLGKLGLIHGQSNKLSTNSTLTDVSLSKTLVAGASDTYKFSINAVAFEFAKSDSLSTVMNKINSSEAGVSVTYSSITDSFSMIAKNSGIGDNIVISETAGNGNLMEALGLTGTDAAVTQGKNALLTVNGQAISRSSNSVSIDGMNIELLKKTETGDAPITVTTKEDASALLDPIKKFVTDYNTMIDLINGLTKESDFPKFHPLSDDEKAEMKDAQIEKWEEKAKSGLLRGDSLLRSIASKLQMTMMSVAEQGGISLYNMGITSAGYQENGKLKIDEGKLTAALKTNSFEIKNLFTGENGLATKMNTVITDAVKTSGVQGTRGSLVEMAGVDATTSASQNNIAKTIAGTNKQIIELQARLTKEESRLWGKFSAMESALQRMNNQSSMVSQFYSGNNA